MRTVVDWSNLPGLALVLILKHITFSVDYIRFRSVCTSWRSVAPKRTHLPWMISLPPPNYQHDYRLISLSASATGDHQHQVLSVDDNPISSNITVDDGFKFYGSSHGWMIFFSSSSSSSSSRKSSSSSSSSRILFCNPVTKSKICSLPIPSCPSSSIRKILASDTSLSKVLVILSRGSSKKPTLAFCSLVRNNNNNNNNNMATSTTKWTKIRSKLRDDTTYNYINAVFYKDRVYVVSRFKIYVVCCTTGLVQKSSRLVRVGIDWPHKFGIYIRLYPNRESERVPIAHSCKKSFQRTNGSYLVESTFGDLLLVLCICPFTRETRETAYTFKIFKLDFAHDWRRAKLVYLERLADCTLFLDFNNAFSLSAAQNGCRENSIYTLAHHGQDVTIYGLVGATLCLHIINPCCGWNLCSWIAPNLLS